MKRWKNKNPNIVLGNEEDIANMIASLPEEQQQEAAKFTDKLTKSTAKLVKFLEHCPGIYTVMVLTTMLDMLERDEETLPDLRKFIKEWHERAFREMRSWEVS